MFDTYFSFLRCAKNLAKQFKNFSQGQSFESKQLMFNRKKTEKLAIVVKGLESVYLFQIINTTFLESGTGKAVAEEVCESLQRWNLHGWQML